MTCFLRALRSGYAVDQAILYEEERLVVVRFGRTSAIECMQVDEALYKISEKVRLMAVIYTVDITEVPDFNQMYELHDPVTIMFFFRNKHMMIDLGTGNNNKINWPLTDKQILIDLIECVFLAARRGRGLAESPYNFSTKHQY
jgi:DIM1 family U5 snRNP protein